MPKVYPYPGYFAEGLTELTENPGTGMAVLQNLQKFQVRVQNPYRTHRSSGYGYKGRTELTQVPGTGINISQNLQMFSVGHFPGKYPGYGSVGTNLTLGKRLIQEKINMNN